jgi:hypothetical protein
MSDFRPLGKAIQPPKPEPKPDEYERFTSSHGDKLMRNKRTGQIETAPPRKIDPVEIDWAAIAKRLEDYSDSQAVDIIVLDGGILQIARDPEFPREEWGSF